MAILKFGPLSVDGAAIYAVPDPKHIWNTPGRNVIVFTGGDIPSSTESPGNLRVSIWSFKEALRLAGKLPEVESLVAGFSARRKLLWAETNDLWRRDGIVTAIRNGIPAINNADMDDIFVAASALNQADI